jgi:esterase/lipase superfamily enzyme
MRIVAAIAAAVVALTACGGRPKGVLTPIVEADPNASQVEMVVVTTRRPADSPGEMFTGERGLSTSFADITVSLPPSHRIGEVDWPSRLPPDPAADFAVLSAKQLSLDDARAWFHREVAERPDRSVLVFVHGFNNRFEDAVFRFAQIVHDAGVSSVPVLATWPSRGSMLAYGYDRESTNYTRDTLENLFQVLADDPSVGEVSILAHSMGNWLTLESLRQMAIRNGRLPAKIKNVMMAAPDVDVDVFRTQIADMGDPRPAFTLFVAEDDKALAVSRRVWGSTARLGAIDPEAEPYKDELARNEVTVIDLTKTKGGDRMHHAKFAESPEIVQLIGARLATGQPMTDSHVGLGEHIVAATTGVAASVGIAAGLVIAAPVAAVDAQTRENYGAQMEALGTSLGGPAQAPVLQRCGTARADTSRDCTD